MSEDGRSYDDLTREQLERKLAGAEGHAEAMDDSSEYLNGRLLAYEELLRLVSVTVTEEGQKRLGHRLSDKLTKSLVNYRRVGIPTPRTHRKDGYVDETKRIVAILLRGGSSGGRA